MEQIRTWFEQIQANQSLLSQMRLGAIPGLIAANASIQAGNILEQNLKTVNDLYLRTVLSDIHTLTTEQFEAVREVAEQCPLIGGKSVYMARVLYNLVESRTFDDELICSTGEERQAKLAVRSKPGVRLYPNPANGQVNLVFGASQQDVMCQLFSTDGRMVWQGRFEQPGLQVSLDLSGIPPGVYYCKVVALSGVLGAVKVLITH